MYNYEDETPAAVDAPAAEATAPTAETPAPNAIVTAAQLADALATGRWTHEVPGTALWLNTSFPPTGHHAESLTELLALHGVAVAE